VIFYLFHSKFNPQGTRIMQVFRGRPAGRGMNKPMLFTFNSDGSDIKLAIRWQQWAPGGHHPNWHPDGEHLIMNLKPDGKTMRFCQFRYDGSEFTVLSEKRLGSGHPSVTPDGRHLVTDAYPGERVALENQEVPIRLVDLEADEERNICTIYTLGKGKGVLRLDPHPAWSRDYKQVCFNGAPEGKRQVFVAKLIDVL
jgi:Tol biopolymer transport system component